MDVDSSVRKRERPGPWPWPRIGHLRHHKPRALCVPASYFKATPPRPAPTISIVTPSLQQGRFIARTLYSVLDQQYQALEYVVQDGGSNDETLDVLEAFAPLLTRWASEPDDGQADAINRGFAQTSGEIMSWLNSDDLLLPGALAYVARYFAEHPKVDVVYGYRLMIDDHDAEIGAWILPAHSDVALTLADHIPQETVFWRRRIWDAAGGRVDSSFTYALDWDLLLRFRAAGATMTCLPRYLGAFRVHDAQKSTTTEDVGEEECALLRERVHGRPVSINEVLHGLRPYLVRHVLVHTRRSALDRLRLRRVRVQTVPPEAWLRALKQPGSAVFQPR
jgi:glycosyltransferase involved in cell wall biosynthesis